LKVLLAVVRTGSMVKTAKQLAISQSVVSKRLAVAIDSGIFTRTPAVARRFLPRRALTAGRFAKQAICDKI
jgi:hypothetical protein